jgi:DNA-binding XRE family transcriptional regulator
MRLNIIRALERELKTGFIDSYDFRRKMDSFCAHGKKVRLSDGRKLREARKAKKWTQQALADCLGCTRRTIIRYESNAEPLSKRGRIWLERQMSLSGEM